MTSLQAPYGATAALFVNHKLNYFEVLRRMEYWLEWIEKGNDLGGHAFGRVRILQRILVKHGTNLWFEK